MSWNQDYYDNLSPEDYDHEEWMKVDDHEKEIEEIKEIATKACKAIIKELYATEGEVRLIALHDAIGDLLEATDLRKEDYPDHVPTVQRITPHEQEFRVHGISSLRMELTS